MGVCDISNKPTNLDKRESLSLFFFFFVHSLLFCGIESSDSVPYKTAKQLTPNLVIFALNLTDFCSLCICERDLGAREKRK